MDVLAYVAGSLDGYEGERLRWFIHGDAYEAGYKAGEKYRKLVREMLGR